MRDPLRWPVPTDERESKVITVWRDEGLCSASAFAYLRWIRPFRLHCKSRRLNELECLTRSAADAFCAAHRVRKSSRGFARRAIRAWAYALRSFETLPDWAPPKRPKLSPLVDAYSHFRTVHRGVAANTLDRDIRVASQFLDHLRSKGKVVNRAGPSDIDSFVEQIGKRLSRRIVATNSSSLRSFLRFLLTTGRIQKDLASLVIAPRYRFDESPPKSLPWEDVRRILRVIPRDTAIGRRNFAALLLMATYGLGGAEVTGLRLENISWKERVLRVRRPKTGISIELPLLPAVGRAIASYLKQDRPQHTTAREVFVTTYMPHRKISSNILQGQIRVYARQTGLKCETFGSHLFRHSHATRQINWGANHKVVADILGHREQRSTSVYIRVALQRLRGISLGVPR
jgi:integrase/recombinase XerD